MTFRNWLSKTFVAAIATVAFTIPAKPASAETDFGQVAMFVARMLENHHYNREDFDDEVSRKLLFAYLEFLDFNHQYFTRKDIDEFVEKYGSKLDDLVLDKEIGAAEEIYNLYEKRVSERVAWIKNLLDTEEFTFDSDRTVDLSREEVDWPADEKAADQLWHNIIEGDLLAQQLAKELKDKEKKEGDPEEGAEPEPEESPKEQVFKRYERYLESLDENDFEDITNYFLSSLSGVLDPHSEYFSQSELENFKSTMDQKLLGIGALLSVKDGAAEIQGVVVGGPADKQGELKINDRIIGVAQGLEGEMVDVMYMKLQKIVELIRGDKDTFVRLKVVPAGEDESVTKEIVIQRDEVKLKDKLATAELIEVKNAEGKKSLMGWIMLPSFYADMEGGTVSMTSHVEKLLGRLIDEGIEGLVLDLRGNGGGSLEEAIKLTGLFIPSGPVVQHKDWRGNKGFRRSENPDPMYDGPMVVLTDKASASASEILAAALQDYRRALVVGENSTFGKGTVQKILMVADAMPFFADKRRAGALKVTIQKFYRIAGGSTQLRGVIPDLIFPSLRDALEIGEASLENPLPYDEIEARDYDRWPALPVAELKERFEGRLAKNPEFQYTAEDTKRLKERMDRNKVLLNAEKRRAEIQENEARRLKRKEERLARADAAEKDEKRPHIQIYALNLDNVGNKELVKLEDLTDEAKSGMRLAKTDEEEGPTYIDGIEPVKREALNVLGDLIELQSGSATALVH